MDEKIAVLILGMVLATYPSRYLPFLVLRRFAIPNWLGIWLRHLPVPIMITLVMHVVLAPEGEIDLSLKNPCLLASIPTAVVVKLTSNLILGILTGIIAYYIIFRFL